MKKETIAMIKQILEDEESLDKLRGKADYEKKQRFPKDKPLKPEREQVIQSGSITVEARLYEMVQATDRDGSPVYCCYGFICNTTIINIYGPIGLCRYFFDRSFYHLYNILQNCDFPEREKSR